jgi:putative glutathione S-transferase
MGLLIDGVWHDKPRESKEGRFVRAETVFRNWVTADGATGFKAEAGRYHLYVAYACPWAHRTLIFRALKGLKDAISLSVVDPLMAENGWTFSEGPGCMPDSVNGARYMHEVYVKAQSDYSGRASVPVLWDKRQGTIVSNESSEIIRMLNDAFAGIAKDDTDYYPLALRGEIDRVNARVYEDVNNGVYKCGFATSQAAYEEAYDALFAALDDLEARLGRQRYLVGDRITEADWRLFTTLVRFDPVYHGHFKCNRQRLVAFPNLWAYTRALYQVPGVAATVHMDHIKQHYYRSHTSINPTQIVPKGPAIDYTTPHRRDAQFAAASAAE